MLSEKLANDIAQVAMNKLQTKTAGLSRGAMLAGLGLGAAGIAGLPAAAQAAGEYAGRPEEGFMTSPIDYPSDAERAYKRQIDMERWPQEGLKIDFTGMEPQLEAMLAEID